MKLRRKEIGMTAEAVAAKIGVSAATIYRYEKGDIEKVPGDLLEPLSRALRTTPAYLMGREDAHVSAPSNVFPLPEFVKKPRLGAIACGKPILASEGDGTFDDVPASIHCDFTLLCKGDSMINARIFDGDIVYIRQQPEVESGEIAAVRIGDEATLKKVYYAPDSGRIILRACNPLHPDLEFDGDDLDNIEILGKAVAFTSTIRI